MPGKINPSMPELMLQVFHQTMSIDQMACFSYVEEDIDLEPTNNPVFFDSLEIIEVIGRGSSKFVEKCVQGISLIELGFANSNNVSTILGLEKFKNPQEVKAFLAENGYKD